jgi:hypothetical protein
MPYQNKEGEGALFVNEKRKPTDPDRQGNITIGGVEYRLVGWLNESKSSGTKFLKLKASPAQRRNQQPAQQNGDDDIF